MNYKKGSKKGNHARKAPSPMARADPPSFVARPYNEFQLSLNSGTISQSYLLEQINSQILGIAAGEPPLALEIRLHEIGCWNLSHGDIYLTVYDPIDTIGSDSLKPLVTKHDFQAANHWAHASYRYKPEVSGRAIALPITGTSTAPLASIRSGTTGAQTLHVQLRGVWRVAGVILPPE